MTQRATGTFDVTIVPLDAAHVPDSGTGALAGITGSLQIIIEKKLHSYIFDYTLDGAP